MPHERFIEAGAVKGFLASQSALALPPGYAALLGNTRLDDGIIKVRGGSALLYTVNGGTGVFQGAFTGSIDGAVWHFLAISVSGVIQIWAALDSVGTWSEITLPNQGGHGNPYGTLRMTVSGAPIRFQIVHDPSFNGGTPHDLLVIQNGIDPPRVWGPPGILGTPAALNPCMALTYQPPQPLVSGGVGSPPAPSAYLPWTTTSVATWSKFLNMPPTSSSVAGGWTYSGGRLLVANTIAVNDAATVGFTTASTNDFSTASQIALIIDCPDPSIWTNIKVFIGDGTNLVTLWDPTVFTSVMQLFVLQSPDGTRVTQAVFPVPIWTTGVAAAVNSAAITTLKFVWVGPAGAALYAGMQATAVATGDINKQNSAAPADNWNVSAIQPQNAGFGYKKSAPPAVLIQAPGGGGGQAKASAIVQDGAVVGYQITTPGSLYNYGNPSIIVDAPPANYYITVLAVAAPQGVLGGTDWAINFASSGSRAMGPRLIITNNVGDFLYNVNGGLNSFIFYPNVQIAVTQSVYYSYSVTYINPGSTAYNQGVDTVCFFSKQPGDIDFAFSDSRALATWNGAWSAAHANPSTFSPALTQDLNFTAPDESIVVIPVGAPMAFANSRFFVGSGSTMWYSEFNLPFQFRKFVRTNLGGGFDSTSGGSYIKSGEIVQAIVPLGAVPSQLQILGVPIGASGLIYILTDHNVYITSGYDAASLNKTQPFLKYGTNSPMSIGIGQTFWYFLAADGQVKRVEGWNAQDITVESVDNLTTNIPANRLVWVWGACANLRYFMAYSQGSGTTNANAMVWSERRNAWESVDTFPAAFTGEALLVDFPSSQARILAYDATPRVYTFDSNTVTDAGSVGIAWSFLGPEFSGGFGNSVVVKEIGVMSDVAAGASLTTTRILACGYGSSFAAVGAIPLDVSTVYGSAPRVVRYDTSGKGAEDLSIQIQLTGTVPGHWKLYEGWAFVLRQSDQDRADRSS